MTITPTQRHLLATLAEHYTGELYLYELASRMKVPLRKATVKKLEDTGLIENANGAMYRITDAGKAALNTEEGQ